MIILDSPVRHPTLRAPGTAPQVGGCGLVSVEKQDLPLQRLVPLEPIINSMKETPQPGFLQETEDSADGVGAGKRSAEEASPKGVSLVLLQGVEAAQTQPGHEKRGREDHRRRNNRTPTNIGQRGKKALDLIATFGISQKPTKNRLPLFFLPFQPVPIGGGNLFQQDLDLPVALDPLPDHLFLIPRNMELFGLAVAHPGEDEGGVLPAPPTSAVRFAAGQKTQGRSGPKKLLPGDDRLEPGTAL